MKKKLEYHEELTLRVLIKDKLYELTRNNHNDKDEHMDYGLYLSRRINDLRDILDKL